MHTISRLLAVAATSAMFAGSVLAEGTMDEQQQAIEKQNQMSTESALRGSGPSKPPLESDTPSRVPLEATAQRDMVGMPLDDPNSSASPLGNNHIVDVDEHVNEVDNQRRSEPQIPQPMTVDGLSD